MSLIGRLRDYLTGADLVPPVPPTAAERAYVVGPAVVEPWEQTWGHDTSAAFDPEYLNYARTSNNVFACVNRRATAAASLPLRLYRGTDPDTRTEVTTGPLRDLLDSVNPWMTFPQLVHMTEQHLCLSGQAFWFVERGGRTGLPKEIWPAPPDLVKVVPDQRDFVRGFLLYPDNSMSLDPRPFEPKDVLWFCYPDPRDPYVGLPPLAAARLAADTATAAMTSNRNIFKNGIHVGGVISPDSKDDVLSDDDARSLQEAINRKFRGESKAHMTMILKYAVKWQQWTMSPRDAEFLGALEFSLEEICRAFGLLPELIGAGSRTFQNAPEARYAFWADTMVPESRFLAGVITERLLPQFGGQADVAEFDVSEVDALKENEDAVWKRHDEQLARGAITINEWRNERGMDPVEWGDDAWMPSTLTPVGGPFEVKAKEMAAQAAANAQPDDDEGMTPERAKRLAKKYAWMEEWAPDADKQYWRDAQARVLASAMPPPAGERSVRVAYGSAEHERQWRASVERTAPHEARMARTVRDLFARQQRSIVSVIARLAEETGAIVETVGRVIEKRWVKTFREEGRPVIAQAILDLGTQAADDLGAFGLGVSFDVLDPNVVRAMERQVQRFAREVNATTWDQLRASLVDGLNAGEGTDQLAQRVKTVMGNRIRSSAETIARTEIVTASTTGTLESWSQSGVVSGSEWLAALDERTRADHVAAHGQVRALGEDFDVGGASGPGPGRMGAADQDINCRCSLAPVLDPFPQPPRQATNGKLTVADLVVIREALR